MRRYKIKRYYVDILVIGNGEAVLWIKIFPASIPGPGYIIKNVDFTVLIAKI